jgi:hypothetical protein
VFGATGQLKSAVQVGDAHTYGTAMSFGDWLCCGITYTSMRHRQSHHEMEKEG